MSEGGWRWSAMSVMPGLTRHPVLSMAESERTEGEKEIVVSLVRQLPPVSEMESADGSGAERGNNPLLGGEAGMLLCASATLAGTQPRGSWGPEGLSAGGGG